MEELNLKEKIKRSRGRTPDGDPNPIDIHVGNRIRVRRQLFGLSQEKLAEMLGLTFQQVQKYERGTNRVGASRLWDISQVLNIDIGFFFEEISENTFNQSPRMFFGKDDLSEFLETESDPMKKEEAIDLITAFNKICNRKPEAGELILQLILSLSKIQ